jgi:diaminohydroxyphosphoribosylaminopyrimidine deaminase/5-amino-6-(5-phosphoribosylamino)uracil reductase
LLRVILDSQLRLPLASRLVQSVVRDAAGESDVLVFCSSGNEEKKSRLEARGIRVEPVPAAAAGGRPDIHAVIRRLGQLEVTSVMIEGGAILNDTALTSGLVDKVFLYYAPQIMGGAESIPFVTGNRFRAAVQVKGLHQHRFGEGFAVEGYLRDPYEE